MSLTDFATIAFAASGTLFMGVAVLGLIRLPDSLCRCHAVAKAMTLGISLLLASLIVYFQADEVGLKVVLAIIFQFGTIPVAGHLLMLLAYKKNMPRWKERPIDAGSRRRDG